MLRWGIILIAFGVVYLIKPDTYRRWFWKRTDVAQRWLTPEQYIVLMRVLGAVFLVVGVVLVAVDSR